MIGTNVQKEYLRRCGVSLVTYAHRNNELEFVTMSEVGVSTDLPGVTGPGPNLAQVDPPHPFQSIFRAVVIAAVVMIIAIGLYVYLGQRPPVASGEVLSTTVYPVHVVINGGAGDQGMAGSNESTDQVLVLTKVRVRNQTDIPLFMQDILMTIKSPDGSDQENIAANDKDIDRVFQAYPSLRYMKADSIHRDITLSPGQAIEGLEIFNFPISKEQWDTLQTAKVVVSFMHQRNLEIVAGR